MAHCVPKATPIYYIDSNYNYVGLICNSMVCCSIWINSASNAVMRHVTLLCTIFLPPLLGLLISNTTANHTITYTNVTQMTVRAY